SASAWSPTDWLVESSSLRPVSTIFGTYGSSTPVPRHDGHHPAFELNEKSRGSGSGKLVPQDAQARFVENRRVSSAPQAAVHASPSPFSLAACSASSGAATITRPLPCPSACASVSRSVASSAGS